jgi:rhodanese-related sulfurtransferase
MRIDLRTHAEAAACPVPADVVLDVPRPPFTPADVAAVTQKLLAATANVPKSTRIEVFCARGRRSALAVVILRHAGFTDVVDLGGAACRPRTLADGASTVTPAQRAAIIEYVRTNRVVDDTAFHAFARSIGVDPDDAEPIVYQLAHDLAWQVRAHHVVAGVALGAAILWLTLRR